MTEQREKNAYFEYLVMPRLKKLFSLCKDAGVDGYLTMGADESIGINASLEQGEVFISYKAYNADFDKLLKLRQNACDMVLTLKYAAESVTDDRELLAPEETVQDADDLKAVLSAYESGIWLGKKDLNYDRERLKEIIPLLLERDLKLTDNSDDGKKPHIMIESIDRLIEYSVVKDNEERPLILLRALTSVDSKNSSCTVFSDSGSVKSGELYEKEIGLFERSVHIL